MDSMIKAVFDAAAEYRASKYTIERGIQGIAQTSDANTAMDIVQGCEYCTVIFRDKEDDILGGFRFLKSKYGFVCEPVASTPWSNLVKSALGKDAGTENDGGDDTPLRIPLVR